MPRFVSFLLIQLLGAVVGAVAALSAFHAAPEAGANADLHAELNVALSAAAPDLASAASTSWLGLFDLLALLGGTWTSALLGALMGAWVAGLLWVLRDAWRGQRVRTWLRHGDLANLPSASGWWGVLSERARKLLRDKDRSVAASEQRLRDFLLAIQNSPNGVVMLDAKDQIEWCNQTASKQLGLDPERDMAQRVGNLLRDPVLAAYMAQTKADEPVVIEGRAHRPDRPVRIAVQRHPYGDGKQLLLTRDVTVVEQAEAMRRDFVANVSHEIRTPLTVLSGFVETIQTLALNEAEKTHYLSLMATQAQRMQSLVDDLLTLSRLEGSPMPARIKALPVSQWLQSCMQEARALSAHMATHMATHMAHSEPLAHAHSFALEIAPELDPAVLLGEARELQSALSNLLSNAVRYTPVGGRITVQVTQESDAHGHAQLCVAVQDTGPGIAAEHLPRLTERFYRVDRSRSRDSGGTGLGLAIVKHVMQRHSGNLRVRSELGQGTCFSLVFPASMWTLAENTL